MKLIINIYLLLLWYTAIFAVNCAKIKTSKDECKTYPCTIFRDDFKEFDFSTWEHIISASYTLNKEFQYYTNNRSNSYIKNGKLYIKPTLTNNTFDDEFLTSGILDLWGNSPFSQCSSNQNKGCYRRGRKHSIINPIQSAAIRTVKSFSFKYGRVNIRAKLPRGDWLWPAFWLMPKHLAYGHWPASGEIDIMESRGNENYHDTDENKTSIGNNHVMQTLHWGPYFPENGQGETTTHTQKEKGTFSDGYNIFSVDWAPNYINFFINDMCTLKVTTKDGFWKLGNFSQLFEGIHNPWKNGGKMAPFDQEFYLIMNVAVGGNNRYFHENYRPSTPWDRSEGNHGKVMKQFWDAREKWLPTWKGEETALKIDYVEVIKPDVTYW